MKKYLLSESGNFYKANLHCHTTVSDGKLTPEEVKEAYKSRGYSIIAYTDHDVMIDHDDLRDDEFLPLLGYELEITEAYPYVSESFNIRRCCHLCYIAYDRETARQVCWNEKRYYIGNSGSYKEMVKRDESLPNYNQTYSKQCINDMIKKGREAGFFVTYNHPKWSLESYPEYSNYEGMSAMEMFNGSSLSMGYLEYNPEVYDDLLRQGKRLYCIGTDDNHGAESGERRYWDFFRAFTMIKAESLEYGAVMKALDEGNFYASEGPEIYELYVEDGMVHVKCSEAVKITFTTAIRRARIKRADDGVPMTEAVFDLPADSVYFRITVTDKNGKHATTNAYFTDEVLG